MARSILAKFSSSIPLNVAIIAKCGSGWKSAKTASVNLTYPSVLKAEARNYSSSLNFYSVLTNALVCTFPFCSFNCNE